MRRIGFSTGALAFGDFCRGIQLQKALVNAVELSALRESELEKLIAAVPTLDLQNFGFVSFHAPSRLENLTERDLVKKLQSITSYVQAIVVHPDVIQDPREWRPIEELIVLENMDQRKPGARTANEMKSYFKVLPRARFCLDIGHARQVDPTLSVAVGLLQAFNERLAEIHISEVDAAGRHVAISSAARTAFRRLLSLIPREVPAIVESIVPPEAIADELRIARASLGDDNFGNAKASAVCVAHKTNHR